MVAVKAGANNRVRVLDIEISESQSWHSDGKSLTVRARVATAFQDHYYSDLRRLQFDSFGHNYDTSFTGKHPLKDGELGDLDMSGSLYHDSESARIFGDHVQYKDVYRIGLSDAEAMVKVMRYVSKALDEKSREEGYHTSFAHYMARVANIVGCVGARITVPDSLKPEWASDNLRYSYNVGDMVYEVNTLTERWWKVQQKTAEEVVS